MIGKNFEESITTPDQDRTTFISPWLTSHSINLLFAPTGLGKSMIGVYLAYCLITGSDFLQYPNLQPARVLYGDGEMGHFLLGDRLKRFAANKSKPIDPNHLRIVSYEDFKLGFPNLSDPNNFAEFEALFTDYDVIIIDNLDTCTMPLKASESDLDMWLRMRPWLFKLKQSGKCIILIHHSNKAGEIYGTSKIGNSLDIGISLTKPGFSPRDENSFKMNFFKSRRGFWNQLYPSWVDVVEGQDFLEIKSRAYADFLREKIEVVSDLNLSDQADLLGLSKQELLKIKHNLGGDFI